MAHAAQPRWRDVQQETPDELRRGQRQLLGPVVVPTVPIGKRHPPVGDGQQAAVAHGDPVRIATQVLQYFGRPAERRLGIDDPVLGGQRLQERCERSRVARAASRPGKSNCSWAKARCTPSR